MLTVLGISEEEERVYRHLLRLPGTTTAEAADSLALPSSRFRTALRALESKGLVSRAPGRPIRLVPTPPAQALDSLIAKRQDEIERARLAVRELADEFRSGLQATGSAELVEVITSTDAMTQRFLQLQRTASSEVMIFDKPPYAYQTSSGINELEIELLERGIAYKCLYDRNALEVPGQLAAINAQVERGEEARVVGSLPVKLVVSDRETALVPLSIIGERFDGAVVIHQSHLLQAIVALFDVLWERATPIQLLHGDSSGNLSESSGQTEWPDILTMLAVGLQDKAIASQLGMDIRSVQRRVRRLMDELNAATRFQAGAESAKRGWV